MIILLYIAAGLVSGIIAGMGMGGGTLLIPILTALCSVGQHAAQGVNILSFIPTAVVAIIIHRKQHLIAFRDCIPIVIAGAVAAGLGSLLALALDAAVLRRLYGGFLAVLCIFQFVSGEKKN